ncbi:class I SAM-dependent DNA methyltransferase [Methanosarcina sp.]|uniref:type I restriction-modification system subunit M n=1 Tax=Methanosarcina sp. TaxID=2213 RepID=UPI0029899A35|nr:class I SAM-dependent DNA methyltransferase [Methanosarcina sp.]MDW5551093.1 class I SAM-dependent DNA methyltransferase [Methanosarcina sp.]MDW5554949.1 class I SAM-dependent DNA methyltransferase [Methanosarcina sp.]MDW5561447.1 class I SAM-dependent DNA methyltransferase [Methanosarcina sp.]
MAGNNNETENRLWDVANELRANSGLKASEYSVPVLGLIFLRYAEFKFARAEEELKPELENNLSSRRRKKEISKVDFQAKGVLYLPEKARYSYLLNLPESENTGKAVNDAMEAIEAENPELADTLPKNYTSFENDLLVALLKAFKLPPEIKGDAFGKIYEYFLGKFAMAEGQKGGEFFTPTSLVRLIVEIIEPYHGRILDPACGSGGMFVQSAHFVENQHREASSEISIYGQEKVADTVRLCKMNLAVHGLSGDIKEGNTYYEDIHNSVDAFDFVMANPPFNVKKVDFEKVKGDKRVPLGTPSTDNANYLWIQHFWSALNEKGRAGFVMANSASDVRGTEAEIRKQLIESNAFDVMVSIGSNFFYTVTLPCTLWFLDKGKAKTSRKDKILFIDAREIFTQVDRAHREFTGEQIGKLAGIVRSYREEEGSEPYEDVKGLCKVATLDEVREQGYSLNPGRYVGVADAVEEDFDFTERLQELNEELEGLNLEARELEEEVSNNINELLGVKND